MAKQLILLPNADVSDQENNSDSECDLKQPDYESEGAASAWHDDSDEHSGPIPTTRVRRWVRQAASLPLEPSRRKVYTSANLVDANSVFTFLVVIIQLL